MPLGHRTHAVMLACYTNKICPAKYAQLEQKLSNLLNRSQNPNSSCPKLCKSISDDDSRTIIQILEAPHSVATTKSAGTGVSRRLPVSGLNMPSESCRIDLAKNGCRWLLPATVGVTIS